MYQKIKKRSALTLIELLISILLFSAITGVAVLMLTAGLKIWSSNKDRLDIRQDGSLAVERMVRYLELANNITAATTNNITFAADVNNNGTDENVTIAYNSGNKMVNITIDGATSTLTPDAQNFSLSYYQSNTTVPFTPPDPDIQDERNTTRIVTISLTMNKGSDPRTSVNLSSSAFCRNQGVE